MKDKTMMRIDKNLLKEIASCKIVPAESYADVVKRMIDKERASKVDYSHGAVMSRLKAQAGSRWNRKRGRAGQSLMPSGF